MTQPNFTLFDTMVGRLGIAWGDAGIIGLQLPEIRPAETRKNLLRRFPDAVEATPPVSVQQAMDAVVALLRGDAADLSDIDLDMTGVPAFHQRVYAAARALPPGETVSYGALAERIGSPGAARAVGQALGRNPFAIVIPCHRVLAAGGKIGGFSANGGITTKLRLLGIEAAHAKNAVSSYEGDGAFGFDPDIALAHLRDSDAAMARLIDQVGPFRMRLKNTPSIFVALAEAIVYQQLNGKAAAAIFARVRALFANAQAGPTARQILRASDEKLLGAGLSRSKLASLRDLARKASIGEVPTLAEAHRMENEEIIYHLTQVRGIGRWTVEMLLMFRLGRPDVLPIDDFGVRKGCGVAITKRGMPTPKELAKRGARWAPYRTVASWYLWRAADFEKKS
jgi:methylated-DNA-[protein]-cysteine S-methyltransferase